MSDNCDAICPPHNTRTMMMSLYGDMDTSKIPKTCLGINNYITNLKKINELWPYKKNKSKMIIKFSVCPLIEGPLF